ncbi:MAG: sugar-binding transcriptional regulator [Rhodobacteraceae bacterium]|nr:sugar-binding transcriptional regulator [Paracoccaceae bacterium]MCY4140505.1 sugar-binding transcriptional regulator [Paracoccaceae bacterium]
MGVSPLGKDSVWEINLAARVAWMSFLGDLTQSEIGKRLGLSPARVHRLILLAREKGLVRISIEGRPAECLDMEAELATRFGLRSCTVSPYLRETTTNEDIAIASVGQTAGQLLGQHLLMHSTRSIAVGTGRTMLAAVTAMPKVPRPDLAIYALNGSLADRLAINLYDVVTKFAERTGGKAYLLPIPYFARSADEEALYLEQPSVAAVRDAAARADIFISGVGALGADDGVLVTELLSNSEAERLAARGAVAEFAGRFLDESGGDVAQEVVFPLSVRTEPGSRSGPGPSPRFFALAAGKRKLSATLAVLRSGAASDLVVDETLAEVLSAAAR